MNVTSRGTFAASLRTALVPLDLHPAVFPPGSAAVTLAGHIPLTLWRLEDGFELAVPRSYSHDFQHMLAQSATGFPWPR